jgi:hypothetical protein
MSRNEDKMMAENENLEHEKRSPLEAMVEITLAVFQAQNEIWAARILAQRLGRDLVPPLTLTPEEYAPILDNLEIPEADRPAGPVPTDEALKMLADRYISCATLALSTAGDLYNVVKDTEKFSEVNRVVVLLSERDK